MVIELVFWGKGRSIVYGISVIYMNMDIYEYVYVYTWIYEYVYIWICICIYMDICVCIYEVYIYY